MTPRTVYRDIDALRGLGAVIDGAAGFGYTLIEDAALPPLSFDSDELEALVLGLRASLSAFADDYGCTPQANNSVDKTCDELLQDDM